ncbi:MAG: Trk system potassium transporter TrkA [Bacteroidales bacterium]|nr:Trk system potassium transporter TrkA [Bacteroidales bacterium]
MKIIIAGDGEVGFYLAKLLILEFQDITLIDTQKEKLDFAERDLGIATVLGDSTSYKVLKQAGIESANLLIAVTSVESSNITTCLIGKKLGAKFTIARIINMEYLADKKTLDLQELGIDVLISPESLATREVSYILKSPALKEIFNLHGKALYLMGLLLEEDTYIVNKTIAETADLIPHNSFMNVAVHRNGTTLIPTGKLKFQKGDLLYFVSTEEGKNGVIEYAGKKTAGIKNVLVIGGSRTGKYIALKLSRDYNIKLIDKDIEKCNFLAKNIPNVQIVCGDGTNVKVLEEERLGNFDAIVSVTGNSETNIFTCLIAKEYGVRKAIAMVENIGLFDYSQKMGIDTLINKKMAAANFIFRYIIKGRVLTHLYGVDASIQEFIVKKNSRITRKPIKELNFPTNNIISGVVRHGKGYITLGNFQIKAEDRVFVFSLPHSSSDINAFFN